MDEESLLIDAIRKAITGDTEKKYVLLNFLPDLGYMYIGCWHWWKPLDLTDAVHAKKVQDDAGFHCEIVQLKTAVENIKDVVAANMFHEQTW